MVQQRNNGKFIKGISGNPKGMRKGTKQTKTIMKEKAAKAGLEAVRALAESYETCINDEALSLYKDFFDVSLSPRDRLNIYKDLIEYLYPKQRSTTVDLTAKTETSITLEKRLSELAENYDE